MQSCNDIKILKFQTVYFGSPSQTADDKNVKYI